MQPAKGKDIAGREPKRFLDMSFGFRAAANKSLRQTDETMSVGEVSIQRQCQLAFPNTLRRPPRCVQHRPQYEVPPRVLRRYCESLGHRCLGCRKTRVAVIDHDTSSHS